MMDIINKIANHEYTFKQLAGIVILSGMIAGLTMPGYGVGFLAWVVLIPLFLCMRRCKTIAQSMNLAFLFGFFFNMVTIFWIFHIWTMEWAGLSTFQTYMISVIVLICLSIYTGWFFGLFGILAKFILNASFNNVTKAILLGIFWVLITNKLLSLGELAFPWSMIEYSQYKYLHLIQIVKFIKGAGLEFLIVFVNVYLAFCLVEKNKNTEKFVLYPKRASVVVMIFAVLFAYGFYAMSEELPSEELKVTIIQTNTNMNELGDEGAWKGHYIRLLYESPPGLIIYPEIASNEQVKAYDKRFVRYVHDYIGGTGKTVIMGMFDYAKDEYGIKRPANAAYVFDRGVATQYIKQYRVPFGEFTPRYLLPKFIETNLFDKLIPEPFVRGREIKVVDTVHGKIAPSICYEVIFPGLIAKQVRMGADYLVTICNPAWFKSMLIKEQLMANSVFRARENSRYVISAVNTGRSYIVAPNGKIIYKSKPYRELVHTHKI